MTRRGPIYYTRVAYSPMPRRTAPGNWHWDIRDGDDGPILAEGHTLTRWGAYRQRERARGRCRRKPVIKHRMAPTRAFSDADRQYGLAVINACLVDFATGMHAATDAELLHESERLEAVPKSPVIRSMRLIVDGERAARAGAVSVR